MRNRLFLFITFLALLTVLAFLFFDSKQEDKDPLYGSWSRCIEGQIKKTYIFSSDGSYMRKKEYFLEENDCTGELSYEHNLYGSFKTFDQKTLSEKFEKVLEITYDKATLTTFDAETTELYKENTVCSREDWESGKELEITGVVDTDCDQFKQGTKVYIRFEYDNEFLKFSRKSFDSKEIPTDLRPGFYEKTNP